MKQKEWFLSVMKYSGTFGKDIQKWIVETEQNHSVSQKQEDLREITSCSEINEVDEIEDDIEPSDSVSNVGSYRISQSQCSSTSSARLKAEAELAALATRQKLLQERHALEEEGEQLCRKKEKLRLDTEIAEKMAKLEVLKAQSTTSGKRTSKVSDGMNSYLKRGQSQQPLNVNAD